MINILLSSNVILQLKEIKDIENHKIKVDPSYEKYVKTLEENLRTQIDKKKILGYIRNKKVEKEKYLKLSDFIEYLTDFFLCVNLDFNMLEDEVERFKY